MSKRALDAERENERLRALLVACRDWFDNPDGEPSSSDLLDQINEALASDVSCLVDEDRRRLYR